MYLVLYLGYFLLYYLFLFLVWFVGYVFELVKKEEIYEIFRLIVVYLKVFFNVNGFFGMIIKFSFGELKENGEFD